jgi:Domain of unknown function (DUF4062)/inactive STAND
MSSAWELFLSSTVRDLKDYRRAVRDACHRKAETTCLLSEEDWSGGYDDTVAKCEERVQRANAFVLLMGYWYGSIPRGKDRSITHIEFDEAFRRWQKNKFPPMAVMTPVPGSAAEKKLRKAAGKILKEQTIDIAWHEQALSKFHAAVTGSWRTVTSYKDKADLREFVIARCWEWKGRTPLAVARGEIAHEIPQTAVLQVSDEQLGRLGRKPQVDAVTAVLAQVTDYATVPAVAMIVSGDDDAGHRAFLSRLINTVFKNYYPKSRLNRLPVECGNPGVLTSWIAQSLGIRDSIQTPEELAERVAQELKRQSMYFVLDRVADLVGGAMAFCDSFWLPFYRELQDLRTEQQFSHRLVAVVTDYCGDQSSWEAASCIPDPKLGPPDYSKLLLIPKLDRFKRSDILEWLDELEIPDEPAGRRSQLANRAMHNSKGQDDPVPIRVFERLRGELLWPEGERQ